MAPGWSSGNRHKRDSSVARREREREKEEEEEEEELFQRLFGTVSDNAGPIVSVWTGTDTENGSCMAPEASTESFNKLHGAQRCRCLLLSGSAAADRDGGEGGGEEGVEGKRRFFYIDRRFFEMLWDSW